MSLEREIMGRVSEISRPFCVRCKAKCCQEIICRESVESALLSRMIASQGIAYDKKNGWMSAEGCRLAFGRPLVCHEFFCDDILQSPVFRATDIQSVISEFAAIGNKAYGNTHLLCIEDLGAVSRKKIHRMRCRMAALTEELVRGRI